MRYDFARRILQENAFPQNCHADVCMYICMNVSLSVKFVRLHVCRYVQLSVCMFICMYVCACMYGDNAMYCTVMSCLALSSCIVL